MIKKRTLPATALLAIAVGLIFPATLSAGTDADPYSGWQLRFYLAGIDFDYDSPSPRGPGGDGRYGIDIGAGLGVNAEYRLSRRLGLDVGVLGGTGVDIVAGTVQIGPTTLLAYDTVSFTPLTAGLDIHLTPDARADLYACPLVALINYGGVSMRTGPGNLRTSVDVDQEFTVGAALGVGVPFGKRDWSFQANVMYLDTDIEGSALDGVTIANEYDVTVVGMGFGYRF